MYKIGELKNEKGSFVDFFIVPQTRTLVFRWLQSVPSRVEDAHMFAGEKYLNTGDFSNILGDITLFGADFTNSLNFFTEVFYPKYLEPNKIDLICIVSSFSESANDTIDSVKELSKKYPALDYIIFNSIEDALGYIFTRQGININTLSNQTRDMMYNYVASDGLGKELATQHQVELAQKERLINSLKKQVKQDKHEYDKQIILLTAKLENTVYSKKVRFWVSAGAVFIGAFATIFRTELHDIFVKIYNTFKHFF